MSRPETRPWRTGSADPAEDQDLDLASLLALVARGDHRAFELVYGKLAGPVYGLVRQVLRDPAQSEEVAQEVLLETAARLALAKARRPPARLQQRVLAAAYRTRQLPPLPSPHPAPVRRRWPHPAQVRRRVPRPVRILAAVAGAAALVLGMTQLALAHRPDVSVQTARTSAGGAVTLIVTRSDQDALLTAARLPAPPDGRVYQVWVIGPAGTRSAGFLSGTGLALTGVRAGERVGVTVEPAGGTSQPTTTPIVLVPVPA